MGIFKILLDPTLWLAMASKLGIRADFDIFLQYFSPYWQLNISITISVTFKVLSDVFETIYDVMGVFNILVAQLEGL